jgi:hypothetical protein
MSDIESSLLAKWHADCDERSIKLTKRYPEPNENPEQGSVNTEYEDDFSDIQDLPFDSDFDVVTPSGKGMDRYM